MSRLLRSTSVAVCLLAVGGCARHVDTAAVAPAAAPGARGGVIAAMRPVAFPMPAAGADMRGTILRAIAPAASATAALTEIIVRVDGGDTLSVVQADAAGLRPGARVSVAGDAPRVTPSGG